MSGTSALIDKFGEASSDNYIAAELASQLYALADRWNIPELSEQAKANFFRAFWYNDDDKAQPHLLRDIG